MNFTKLSQIVMVPGLLSTDAVYQAQVDALAGRAIISETRLDDDITSMARRLLVAAPERFILCGHSMGGYVALEVVRLAPERVEALALVGTSAKADTAEQTKRRHALVAMAKERGIDAVARLLNDKLFATNPEISSDHRTGLEQLSLAMAIEIGTQTFARQQAAIVTRRDQTGMLAAITVPTVVVSGTEDQIIPLERSEEMASAIPGAELIRLEGVGHMIPIEAPHALSAALLNLGTRLAASG